MAKTEIFKSPLVALRAGLLNPLCVDIMSEMLVWCADQGLPFMITETVTTAEEDAALKRVSKSHLERRAFDISVQHWLPNDVLLFTSHFNDKYKDVAAISKESGKPTLVVDETNKAGRTPHLHVQIHKRFAFNDNNEET